ncbi:protein translocase subunit SecA-like [Boleophthalmus pectinirostris]|uniref:protein translocase subunit SecA-like n=1 Tax=Boleophthalmus pectinirostris TaxID=150288 RepID=UPI00242FB89B|nr:protein translocase subunit SecA-like [Boleophthalmus pectinirostris]
MADRERLLQLLQVHLVLHPPPTHTEELLTKLQGLVTNIFWSLDGVIELFTSLLKRFDSKQTKEDLQLWLLKMLHCVEINYITPNWKSTRSLIELIQDTTITDGQLQQILGADTDKTLDEIISEIEQQNSVDKKLLSDAKQIVLEVNSQLKHKYKLTSVLQKLVAAVKKTMKITPRLTQMVSWALMALSAKGRLIQVSTGEGKTCIVAMFAAFRALQGHKVDIMSSSPILADRDFKEWQTFYKELKISVSCNINKVNSDLKKCYDCQVVYGTSHEFAADWLRQHFGREDIRGDRPFQCAIVDEVDSLMLDKGCHTVYLGSEMPALQHLNPLLAHIWYTVNQYTGKNSFKLGPKAPFHHIALESLSLGEEDQSTILKLAEVSGLIEKGSVDALKQDPSLFPQITANISPEKLAAFYETIEDEYKTCHFVLYSQDKDLVKKIHGSPQHDDSRTTVSLLLHDGGVCQYIYRDNESLLRAVKSEIMNTLYFTPCDLREGRTNCYIPGFLRGLVDSKIEDWIENAFHAQTITKDHDYVIEGHGVVPVDFKNTGVLENSMQWTDGLHQFLEMKHQNKLSDMSAVTNFMSNVGLLHMYGDQIYGVTGTLGQKVETDTLQKIYKGITACYIPTFKRRKLFEVQGVIVNDEDEWLQKICDVIRAQTRPTTYRGERAVLVICETIRRAKAVHQALGESVQNKVFYISNNMDNRAVTHNGITAGKVIIATNLAGRGTDLKVSASVNSAGGLFVLQTFLPLNARVEAQAFGRTGRRGNPGSAQLIICSEHLPETLQLLVLGRGLLTLLRDLFTLVPLYRDQFERQLRIRCSGQDDTDLSQKLSKILSSRPNSGVELAKKVRDESVAEKLKDYLQSVIPKMKMKQELFIQYLNFIDDFYQSNSNQLAESDVSALHEFWGMWLFMNDNDKEPSDVQKNKLSSDLERARNSLREGHSPLSNLHHYTLFGNKLLKQGHFKDSILMYSRAIELDHCWAAIAFYNRAFARLAQQDNNQDPDCIDQALEDLQEALKSVELYCLQQDLVYRYSKAHLEAEFMTVHTRFDHHQNTRYKVFLLLTVNIKEAIGKLTKARTIGGHVKVRKLSVFFLAPISDYLPSLVLASGSASLLRSTDQLRLQQLINHSAFDIHHELHWLMSLGLTDVFVLDTRFSLQGFFSRLGRAITQ